MAMAAALLLAGPGRYSTHEVVERRLVRRGGFLLPRRRRALSVAKLLEESPPAGVVDPGGE